jgi:ferrous iron transport protein A
MLLSELQVGETGIVKDMGNLNTQFKNRLMDMGIYRDAKISLINTMAFGKMFIVEVDDVEICIRRSDAERIELI